MLLGPGLARAGLQPVAPASLPYAALSCTPALGPAPANHKLSACAFPLDLRVQLDADVAELHADVAARVAAAKLKVGWTGLVVWHAGDVVRTASSPGSASCVGM